MAVIILGAATAFPQTYVFTVIWDSDECSCVDQGDSYYEIRYNIYDDANHVVVNPGALERVDFGTYTVDIEVPEVNSNCANQLVDPEYIVRVEVVVMCDSYTPPQGICSTGTKTYPFSCDDFAQGEADTELLYFVE